MATKWYSTVSSKSIGWGMIQNKISSSWTSSIPQPISTTIPVTPIIRKWVTPTVVTPPVSQPVNNRSLVDSQWEYDQLAKTQSTYEAQNGAGSYVKHIDSTYGSGAYNTLQWKINAYKPSLTPNVAQTDLNQSVVKTPEQLLAEQSPVWADGTLKWSTLQWADKVSYDELTPEQKKKFDMQGQEEKLQGQDQVRWYLQFIRDNANNKTDLNKAREYQLHWEALYKQSTDLTQGIDLKNAQTNIDNLKQNYGYLWNNGQPWVSHQYLEWMSRNVDRAQEVLKNLNEFDKIQNERAWIATSSSATSFAKNMRDITNNLNDNLANIHGKVLSQFQNESQNIDDPKVLDKVWEQLMKNYDWMITGVTKPAIAQQQFLIDSHKDYVAQQRAIQQQQKQEAQTQLQQSMTPNMEYSQAQGYMYNQLGKPIISADGSMIRVPSKPPLPPHVDYDTWILTSYTTDEATGQIVASVKKIFTPQVKPVSVSDGTTLVDPNTGKVIYDNVKNFANWNTANTSVSWDLRGVASTFPWQAWAKNNNPAGITWNANFDTWKWTAKLLADAGIQFSKWTARPVGEGGNYVTFNTIEDGLLAQQIMMVWTYGNSTVNQMLQSWVWTSEWPNYAKQVAWTAWVNWNMKVSDLSQSQLESLQMAKIQKESPWLYKLLSNTQSNSATSINSLWQYMKDNQDRWNWYSNDDVKSFNEKIDRMVSVGDEKGMAIAYRNMVMKDKGFKKEFDDTTVFTKSLDTVQSLINDYEMAGKSTNALNSMAEKIWRKLGLTTDTALAQLQTQLWVTMANYIRSISGTAASDVEVQRLMWNMANIGNIKDLNTTIVSQVKDNATNGIKQMIDNRMYW
jgi:ribosomal protein S13